MAQFLGMDFGDNAGPLLQGLLAGAGAALASRGNRTQAIGSGLLGAVGGYDGAVQNQAFSDYRQQQAQRQKMATDLAQRRDAYLQGAGSQPQPAPPTSAMPTPGAPVAFAVGEQTAQRPASTQGPGWTWEGLLQNGFTPEEAQQILSRGGPKLKDFDIKDVTGDSLSRYLQSNNPADLVAARERKVATNGQVYDPYSVQPGTVFNDPNAAFMINGQGQIVANTPYQQFALNKARAGAAQTSVKIENKTGESLAGQIGPMMKDSLGDAEAAVKGMDAANRIMSSLNSGNVFSGKLGNAGLTVTQWKDALGIAGPDDKAALANTRGLMQGLAQLTLQGRQQMKGQGQITENEGKLAERVSSGDFTLTPEELRTLAGAAQRTSQHLYGNYRRRYDALRGNENFAPMAPYYEAPALPDAVMDVQAGSSNIDNLLNKYR